MPVLTIILYYFISERVNAPEELIAQLKEARLTPMEGNGAKEDVMPQIYHSISESLASQIKDVTEGWDIVIGMRQDAINKGLQYAYDKNLFPHTVAWECESPLKGFDKIKINAELSAPNMAGGTGSNITVAITVKSGTLEFTGRAPIKADISNLGIELTLNLVQIKSLSVNKAYADSETDFLPDKESFRRRAVARQERSTQYGGKYGRKTCAPYSRIGS